MKRILIIICLVFCSLFVFSTNPTIDSLYHRFSAGLGFALGPENGVSFIPPKLSFYYYIPVKNYEKYAGIEFASHFIIVYFSSFDALVGIKSKHFSFDTSISYLIFPETYYDNEFYPSESYFALNPKIGLKLGWFWFKTGPSFIFGRNNFPKSSDFGKIGNLRYNFELSLQIPFKIPDYRKIALYNNRLK